MLQTQYPLRLKILPNTTVLQHVSACVLNHNTAQQFGDAQIQNAQLKTTFNQAL